MKYLLLSLFVFFSSIAAMAQSTRNITGNVTYTAGETLICA